MVVTLCLENDLAGDRMAGLAQSALGADLVEDPFLAGMVMAQLGHLVALYFKGYVEATTGALDADALREKWATTAQQLLSQGEG